MNDNKRHYSSKRTIVPLSVITDNADKYGLFCVNLGIMQVARELLGERGLWRTTYRTDGLDNGVTYTIPDVSEFAIVTDKIAEFLGVTDMSCDVVAGLNNIADKIANLASVGNCAPSTIDGRLGAQSPLSNPTTFGGSGEFATQDEFDNHKCFAATSIVNGLYSNLQVLGSIDSFSTIVAGGLAVLILSGFLALPLMPFIVALSAGGFVAGSLLAVKAAFDFDALKCALYNSENAVEAYDALEDMLDEVGVSIYGVGVTLNVVKQLIMSMANIDVMNKLFTPLTYYDDGLSDCSDCVDDKVFGFLQYGNVSGSQDVTFSQPGTYVFQSESYVGYHWVSFGLDINPNTLEWTRQGHAVTVNGYAGGGNIGCAHRIANTTVVNFPSLAGCSESGMWVQTSTTRLTGNWNGVTAMTWQQSQPFTVSVTIS